MTEQQKDKYQFVTGSLSDFGIVGCKSTA